MWNSVTSDESGGEWSTPSARSKHSATLVGEYVYILGGRNGNLSLKDFWRYNLISGKWQLLKATGDKLPCLQEHTAVAYKENIYVFGGEISFSTGTETPLWVYNIKSNSWRKIKTKKGVTAPKGRRGHTALVHNGSMLIYGGYQDLKGSSGEFWSFLFETEAWHLICCPPLYRATDQCPPPRHRHSAVIHSEAMWIYGGMTDLQERGDFWKWDFYGKTWTNIKTKINPGPLHGHAYCKMPSSMILFGGERNGQICNDVWRYNFDLESWEKITISGIKPQPRSECRAFVVSELLLKGTSKSSVEARTVRIRARTCNSADRGNRHSSYLPNNRVAPSENTYVFKPSKCNYTDGSNNLAQQFSENSKSSKSSFLQEISKLSQINLSKISHKCSYTVLTKGATESTESLLKQHASPQQETVNNDLTSTPSRGTMVKSKSAYAIKKKYNDTSPYLDDDEVKEISRKKRVEFDTTIKKIPRDPISVPNFSMLTLPTPVLTPVEASKLVYLTDEETDVDTKVSESNKPHNEIQMVEPVTITESLPEDNEPLKRSDSYSSHLGYSDSVFYHQDLMGHTNEKFEENFSSTSDYYSIETVNRLSSASSYSVKTSTPQEDNLKIKDNDKEGPFGFCNPNYMGPVAKSLLTNEEKRTLTRLFSADQPQQTNNTSDSPHQEQLELVTYDGHLNKNTKVVYRLNRRSNTRLTLPLKNKTINQDNNERVGRAHSAGRADTHHNNHSTLKNDRASTSASAASTVKEQMENIDPFVPLYVYVIGGKEKGHVTVFQRPISIWRLKLF